MRLHGVHPWCGGRGCVCVCGCVHASAHAYVLSIMQAYQACFCAKEVRGGGVFLVVLAIHSFAIIMMKNNSQY